MKHYTRHSAQSTGALDDLSDQRLSHAMSYLAFLRHVGRPWFVRPLSYEGSLALDLRRCGLVEIRMEQPWCVTVINRRRA